MKHKLGRIIPVSFIVLLLGLTLAASLELIVPTRAAPAGGPWYVNDATGNNGNDCLGPTTACRTINGAMGKASSGDTIFIAAGVYTETVDIHNTTLTLIGAGAASTFMNGEGANDSVVEIMYGAVVTITGVTIQNGSMSEGGGIYIEESKLTLDSVSVVNNTVTGGGGGICALDSTLTLSNTAVVSNTAAGNGGGIYNSRTHIGADMVLINSSILSNTASGDGGGIYNSSQAMTLTQGTVKGNRVIGSGRSGGGIYSVWRAVWIADTTIAANSATSYGGGVYIWTDSANLVSNQFYSNTADIGGGIYLYQSHNATFAGNRVYRNTADHGYGGVAFVLCNDALLVNNEVFENRLVASGSGSGVGLQSSGARFLHNTIARNSGGDGQGVFLYSDSTAWMTNTILVSHTVGIYVNGNCTATLEAALWGAGDWANGQDVSGAGIVTTGTVSIWQAPGFVNPDVEDYHLAPSSAAIDAGVDAGVTSDIDGDARPQGANPDLGADEFVPVALTGVSIAGATSGVINTDYSFTATVSPADASMPITYTWSPVPVSGQGSSAVTYMWNTSGIKIITVTAENVSGSAVDTYTITVSDSVVPVASVSITGPTSSAVNTSCAFTATVSPTNATEPITYTWSPEPTSGQGAQIATFSWGAGGTKTITVTAQNAGNTATDTHDIAVWIKVYLPVVMRQ